MAGTEKYRGRKKNVPQVLDEQSSIKQLATAERSVVDAIVGRLVSDDVPQADTLGRRGQAGGEKPGRTRRAIDGRRRARRAERLTD